MRSVHSATLGKGKSDDTLVKIRKGDLTGKGEVAMVFGKQVSIPALTLFKSKIRTLKKLTGAPFPKIGYSRRPRWPFSDSRHSGCRQHPFYFPRSAGPACVYP